MLSSSIAVGLESYRLCFFFCDLVQSWKMIATTESSFGMVVNRCSFAVEKKRKEIRNDPKFYDFASLQLGPRV